MSRLWAAYDFALKDAKLSSTRPSSTMHEAKLLEGFFWARGLKNHVPGVRNMVCESLKKPRQSKQSVSV